MVQPPTTVAIGVLALAAVTALLIGFSTIAVVVVFALIPPPRPGLEDPPDGRHLCGRVITARCP